MLWRKEIWIIQLISDAARDLKIREIKYITKLPVSRGESLSDEKKVALIN